MQTQDTRERELRPLRRILDNYEKIVLSMDRNFINSYDGIKSLNPVSYTHLTGSVGGVGFMRGGCGGNLPLYHACQTGCDRRHFKGQLHLSLIHIWQ